MDNCEGCYNSGYSDQRSCSSSCFDQNLNTGSMLQPGPFNPSSFAFGNRGVMDYNGINLFGSSNAFMGVPSDGQFGIVKETALNKRENLSSDKSKIIREPIGRGFRTLEDFENSLEKDDHFRSSKENYIGTADRINEDD